jgi:hypothetical protein
MSEVEHFPRLAFECRGRLVSSEASWKESLRDLLETLLRIITGGVVERDGHI